MKKKNRNARKYTKPLKADKTTKNSSRIVSKVLDIFPDKIKDKEYLTKEYKTFVVNSKFKKAYLKHTDILECMFCLHLLHNGDERIRKILLSE
jgi:hypothetical protein